MNPSNLAEQHFCAISRRIQTVTREAVDKLGGLDNLLDSDIDYVFDIILRGIELFGTEQYPGYLNTTLSERRDIIIETCTKECYVHYRISSGKKYYDVIASARGTVYEPRRVHYWIPTDDGVGLISKEKVMIAPQYIMLLAKTPEHYLACSSAKTNHHDLPVSVGPKMRQNMPYRNSPVKMISETEARLYEGYVGSKGLAEMKDRANSVITHKLVYLNTLRAGRPTDIETQVDREEHPFGTDKAIEYIETTLNVTGIDLTYVKED